MDCCAYSICALLATGVRYGLTPDIYAGFEGEPLEVHKRYLDMRSKHIAHSVNPFEQVKVGAVLSPPASENREVQGVSTLSMKLVHDSLEGVGQLRFLARTALEIVATRSKELEQKVLEESKQMSVDDLYARASPRTVVAPPKAAGSRR